MTGGREERASGVDTDRCTWQKQSSQGLAAGVDQMITALAPSAWLQFQ